LFSICPSIFATVEIKRDPIARSVRMWFDSKDRRCAGTCEICGAKDFEVHS